MLPTDCCTASAKHGRCVMSGSLLKAIFQQKAEWNAYLAASLDADDAPRNYVPSLKRIEEWSTPAADRGEAAAALRLAIEFYEIGDSDVIPAMMKAALGFLEYEPQ